MGDHCSTPEQRIDFTAGKIVIAAQILQYAAVPPPEIRTPLAGSEGF